MRAEAKDVSSFGLKVFLVADGLFFFALFYIGLFARAEAELEMSRVVPTFAVWPLFFATFLHRRGRLGGAAALAALALAGSAFTLEGLPAGYRFAATLLWTAHVAIAVLLLAVARLKGRSARETPGLGRFTAFLAIVGVVYYVLVFPW